MGEGYHTWVKNRPTLGILLLIFIATGSTPQTTPYTRTPFKHMVIIMMENHSFDNIFGVYPLDNNTVNNPIARAIEKPSNLLGLTVGLNLTPVQGYSTPDPVEGRQTYLRDWDQGKMDGFRANSGVQAMTYYTSKQLALEWDLAELFAIGDEYFSAYMGPTTPNRLMSLAGYTPVSGDYGPPPYIPFNQTIFAELDNYGVSWGYYVQGYDGTPYPLNYLYGAKSLNVGGVADFERELSNGTLPPVSWVMPVGGGESEFDQHPPYNVTAGELWLMGVVDHVMESRYWSNTVVFITYDEGGGYYDSIPPTTLDGSLLGFRVPFIVVSAYTKEGYVSHTLLNHCSLLAFIDYNWGLPPLNRCVGESNIPLDVFYFQQSRPPIVLNNSSVFPVPPQIPFDALPYSRSGSTSTNLGSMGVTPWVGRDKPVYPIAGEVLGLGAFLTLISTLIIVGRLRRGARGAGMIAWGSRSKAPRVSKSSVERVDHHMRLKHAGSQGDTRWWEMCVNPLGAVGG